MKRLLLSLTPLFIAVYAHALPALNTVTTELQKMGENHISDVQVLKAVDAFGEAGDKLWKKL